MCKSLLILQLKFNFKNSTFVPTLPYPCHLILIYSSSSKPDKVAPKERLEALIKPFSQRPGTEFQRGPQWADVAASQSAPNNSTPPFSEERPPSG